MNPRTIKTFNIDGVAVDQEAILRLRGELENRIIEDMRGKGYVPRLDVTPELYWEYQREEENFKFVVIVYGSYLGKKKSQSVLGLLGHHEIMFEPNTKQYEDNPE